MLPQFQLNCTNAQDNCLICLTEAMGLSVYLTSHEQFSPNQVIYLASYSPPGNITDKSSTDFFILNIVEIFQIISQTSNFSCCLRGMSQEYFRLSKCFLNLNSYSTLQAFCRNFRKLGGHVISHFEG